MSGFQSQEPLTPHILGGAGVLGPEAASVILYFGVTEHFFKDSQPHTSKARGFRCPQIKQKFSEVV